MWRAFTGSNHPLVQRAPRTERECINIYLYLGAYTIYIYILYKYALQSSFFTSPTSVANHHIRVPTFIIHSRYHRHYNTYLHMYTHTHYYTRYTVYPVGQVYNIPICITSGDGPRRACATVWFLRIDSAAVRIYNI